MLHLSTCQKYFSLFLSLSLEVFYWNFSVLIFENVLICSYRVSLHMFVRVSNHGSNNDVWEKQNQRQRSELQGHQVETRFTRFRPERVDQRFLPPKNPSPVSGAKRVFSDAINGSNKGVFSPVSTTDVNSGSGLVKDHKPGVPVKEKKSNAPAPASKYD